VPIRQQPGTNVTLERPVPASVENGKHQCRRAVQLDHTRDPIGLTMENSRQSNHIREAVGVFVDATHAQAATGDLLTSGFEPDGIGLLAREEAACFSPAQPRRGVSRRAGRAGGGCWCSSAWAIRRKWNVRRESFPNMRPLRCAWSA